MEFIEPPKKGAPLTRARIKSMSTKNIEKLLNPPVMNNTIPTKKTPKIQPKLQTDQTSLTKPNEIETSQFFTDLSFPTGFN